MNFDVIFHFLICILLSLMWISHYFTSKWADAHSKLHDYVAMKSDLSKLKLELLEQILTIHVDIVRLKLTNPKLSPKELSEARLNILSALASLDPMPNTKLGEIFLELSLQQEEYEKSLNSGAM